MSSIEQRTVGRSRKYVFTDDDGVESIAPSVTTVLGALPKGGLDWYGFKLGLQAAQVLAVEDQLVGGHGIQSLSVDEVYELAKGTDYAPHKALKRAGNRGTDVHAVAETLLRDGKLDTLPQGTEADERYVDALVKWHDERGVADWTMVAIEARLFSHTHGFAGTTDFIAVKPDGTYVIGDFKTSKGVYESHTIQAAAYADAAREMGLLPNGAFYETQVIRLGVDGEYEVFVGRHTIDDFLAVKAVHEMLANKDKKAVKA